MHQRLLAGMAILLLWTSCAKTRMKDHPEWGKYYDGAAIKNACFIMRDNNHESVHYYNKNRCLQRFAPGTTFDVFNATVALETAIAPSDQFVIRWDSVHRRADWDKDLTMRDAFNVGSQPYFKELASRIGPGRMQHYLDTIKYGNMTMAGHIDSFWSNNSLQVSADEQAGFLKRIYFAELPFSELSQRVVKTMLLREQTPTYNLYYQTGEVRTGDKITYWVIGFTEKIVHVKEPEGSMNKSDIREYPYFFAQNFDVPASEAGKDYTKTGIELMRNILLDYGALPKAN